MAQPGGFRVTNRQYGNGNINPGLNTGAGVVTQPFVYGVAQVESIIVNEERSGDNIKDDTRAAKLAGRAKIRILNVDDTTSKKNLYYADPINAYQSTFPLAGEYVLVFRALGRYYYTGPININRRITQNAQPMYGDLVEAAKPNNIKNRQRAALGGVLKQKPQIKTKAGDEFLETNAQPVKIFEGDVVYQGRYGHSIRFGTSQMHLRPDRQSPNIVLRTGQSKKSLKVENNKSSLTIEDLDNDASSIYMTSDELLPFTPATKDSSTFLYSMISKPSEFNGAQVLVNSDTLVLNSKLNSIYMFAKEGIHLNSLKQGMTLDSEGPITKRTLQDLTLLANVSIIGKAREDITYIAARDVNIDAGRFVVIRSNETYLGGYSNRAEPIVMGITLKLFFIELLKVLSSTQPLTVGPTGAINPAVVARLTMTYARYLVVPGPINPLWASDDNLTVKVNEKTQGLGFPVGKGVQI